jgi:hypothetical protein
MKLPRDLAGRALVKALFLLASNLASHAAGVDVLTYHNDNLRTGANLKETILTPANVNSGQFGKLFDQAVDGYVYGQPLYVSGLGIAGSTHNVVYVVTEHDSVYAFDADSDAGPNAAPLWHASFIDPAHGITTVPSADVGSDDIVPEIGITSTPVIDRTRGTIYVLAKTKENGAWFQRLHALELATGAEKPGSPVTIAATALGNGGGSVNGLITFDALIENQRSALLLLNGVIYIAWASHGDNGPAHGWVIGYNEQTLAQVSTYIATPDGGLGDIWMSGCGPSADATGNIYVATGNGTFDTDPSGHHLGNNFGDSLLKLSTANGGLALSDFFTPANQAYLNDNDVDFGSCGVMLLPDQPGPHPHLGIAAGKDAVLFVFDRDRLGGYFPDNTGVYESLPNGIPGSFATPAYFDGRIYIHAYGSGGEDVLKAFAVRGDYVDPAPVSNGADFFDYPGATPAISASGAANGIVWEIENTGAASPATLHASRADDVSRRLYTSDDAGVRDNPAGHAVKFTVPAVSNGKVYIGTDSTLTVFGPLSDTTPLTVNINGPGSVTPGFSGVTDRRTNTPLAITAAPSAGAVFDSWTDGDGNLITRSPAYSFAMRENLVLNANFLTNPFPGFAGNYTGLIQGNSPTIAATGYLSLSVGKGGLFTASIRFAGRAISLHGAFTPDGTFAVTLQPGGVHSTVISLALDGSGGLTGTISTDLAGGDITGAAVVTSASPAPEGLIGSYTLLFPVPADPTAPQGIGYGSATVDKFGHIRLAGVLGDGAAFTNATTITRSQTWTLFTPLYAGKGVLTGVLTFENNGGLSDLDGQLFWFKPRPGSPPLSAVTGAIGSVYHAVNPILPLTSGTGAVTLQLPAPISQPVTAGSSLTLSGAGPLTLTFNPATGLFIGSFTGGKYGGAVFQDQNLGGGTYILGGATGAVNLQ